MKKPFYIDYPQEHIEGQAHSYRCAYCKVTTTNINGNLEGHLADCQYRVQMEQAGFECEHKVQTANADFADDFD